MARRSTSKASSRDGKVAAYLYTLIAKGGKIDASSTKAKKMFPSVAKEKIKSIFRQVIQPFNQAARVMQKGPNQELSGRDVKGLNRDTHRLRVGVSFDKKGQLGVTSRKGGMVFDYTGLKTREEILKQVKQDLLDYFMEKYRNRKVGRVAMSRLIQNLRITYLEGL